MQDAKKRTLEYMERVQAFGEQHPDFGASHAEFKRRYPERFGKCKHEVTEADADVKGAPLVCRACGNEVKG